MKKADSKALRLMIRSAANELLNNVDKVNDMNVFPVPDGDTGTNMSLTFHYENTMNFSQKHHCLRETRTFLCI